MQLFYLIIIKTLIYSLIAFSFTIIYRVLKCFLISHALTLTLGAYATYFWKVKIEVDIFISSLLAVLFCVLVKLLLTKYLYIPLSNRNTKNWQYLIVSLGVYIVFQNLISLLFGDMVLSFRFWPITNGIKTFGAYLTEVQFISIWLIILILLVSVWLQQRTSLGNKIEMVSSNSELASVFGVSYNYVVYWVIGIGSALGAIAGILIAADTNMNPTMGFNWFLYGVIAMIIGGIGKLRFQLLGALILASTQVIASYYIGSKWMDASAYLILITFLFFRPYGISRQPLRKTHI